MSVQHFSFAVLIHDDLKIMRFCQICLGLPGVQHVGPTLNYSNIFEPSLTDLVELTACTLTV